MLNINKLNYSGHTSRRNSKGALSFSISKRIEFSIQRLKLKRNEIHATTPFTPQRITYNLRRLSDPLPATLHRAPKLALSCLIARVYPQNLAPPPSRNPRSSFFTISQMAPPLFSFQLHLLLSQPHPRN